MSTISELFSTFKKPLIIAAVALIIFLVVGTVIPSMRESNAYKTPITEIKAENEKVYLTTDEVLPEDFIITAIHENGAETPLDPAQVELSKNTIDKTGAFTTITLTYTEDSSIYCNVDVKVERQKVVGFECGYPNVSNVIATLYTNGELCFEGEGDTLVAGGGAYAWKEYADKIVSVTFEKGVQPRIMDYWFSDMQALSYVAPIPSSVQSMKGTFRGCAGISTIADWTNCIGLLNIDECYSGCVNLKYTVPVPGGVIRANDAFKGCYSLQKTPNLSSAESMLRCSGMFTGCTKLVSVTIPPNADDISYMFSECTNLQVMPSIPESVTDMTGTFSDCTAMKTLAVIPEGVKNMESCFSNCEFIQGTVFIHANPDSLSGCFSGACVATRLDLTGNSLILDAFANTNEGKMVTVNGKEPNPQITSLQEYERYLEEAERARQEELEKEQNEQNQTT